MPALWLALALGCLVGPARSAGPPPSKAATDTGCTLVFGHGRNPSDDDPAANRSWDEANRAMASQVASELAGRGQRIVRLLLPVTVTDVPAIIDGVLQRALQQGCSRIVESALFADDDSGLIVARLRAYAVQNAVIGGAPARIGATLYTQQQEYPATQRNLERLMPAALGRQLAEDYLARPGER